MSDLRIADKLRAEGVEGGELELMMAIMTGNVERMLYLTYVKGARVSGFIDRVTCMDVRLTVLNALGREGVELLYPTDRLAILEPEQCRTLH